MIERLREILGRTDHRALVAAVDGTVVGMAGAFVGRRYESDAPYGHLLALVVSDAHRRAGIGRDLVVAAERWLASRGAGCIIVHSGSHRADAHAFYRSLGYEDTGFRFLKVLGARTDRT
jgi:GNAT superfamily N-acetyltransferase